MPKQKLYMLEHFENLFTEHHRTENISQATKGVLCCTVHVMVQLSKAGSKLDVGKLSLAVDFLVQAAPGGQQTRLPEHHAPGRQKR